MKSLLFISAFVMATSTAMASKVRLSALGDAAHLTDVYSIWTNPAKLHAFGDFVTFESGPSTVYHTTVVGGNTTTGFASETALISANTFDKAEGGFITSQGDARFGVFFGHISNSTAGLRSLGSMVTVAALNSGTVAAGTTLNNANTLLTQENPIDLFYGAKSGDNHWAVNLSYSSSDAKADKKKQTTALTRLGLVNKDWDVAAQIGLASNAVTEATPAVKSEFSGKPSMQLDAGKRIGTMYAYGQYKMGGANMDLNGTERLNLEVTGIRLGINETMKVEAGEFFYGAAIAQDVQNDKLANGIRTEVLTLPFIAGLELDATSWMALRASITQNVLIGSVRASDTSTIPNNTKVAIGTGMKFNKWTVDAAFEGLAGTTASSKVNANTLFAKTALTYNF